MLGRSIRLFLRFLRLVSCEGRNIRGIEQFLNAHSILARVLAYHDGLRSLRLSRIVSRFRLLGVLIEVLARLIRTRLESRREGLLFPVARD